MKLRKSTMLALAATFTVSGMTALSAPAQAEVTYESMLVENGGDLERNHWASNAIKALVNKYGVMSGYPDKKFRGSRTLTRYEMAAALYQLLKYVDAQDAKNGGVDTSNLATKEDMRQMMALHMELKKELDMLKEGHMDLSKRVDKLEKVQVHGKVEVRYRDRVSVTDGTQTSSPLFASGNSSATRVVGDDGNVTERTSQAEFSNNGGQYVRDANGLPTQFNSPAVPNITIDDLVPFRIQAQLNVSADLTDGISAHSTLDMYEFANVVNGGAVSNGGHDVNEGGASNFVLRKGLLKFGGMDDMGNGAAFKVGLMNFSNDLTPGTMLSNHFGASNWNGHGYGLVGWGGADVALARNGVDNYRNSLSRYWSGGLDASMVDPDSKGYNQATAPSASFSTGWGWGKFMVGANYGSTQTNRQQAAAGNLGSGTPVLGSDDNFKIADADSALFNGSVLQGLDRKETNGRRLVANHLALPSQYGDGYMVTGLDLMFFKDAFPVRIGAHAMSYLNDNMLDFANPSRKEVSGVVDLGWDKNFGMTISANKSFIGFDRHSVGLLFNDLGGSGFDIQLGANLATRGIFNVSDIAAGNAGLVLGIPFWNGAEGKDNIKLLLAARQSIGDNMGALTGDTDPNQMFKDSGVTASLNYSNVGGSPLNITAQYSALMADELWAMRFAAHDVSVISSYKF